MLEKEDYTAALEHDQLQIESQAGRTLHMLVEADIDFPPSYKYKKGTNQLVAFSKRTPSWCDRILHLPSVTRTVTQYTSIHMPNPSDHKPVVALYSVEESSHGSAQARTRQRSPYPVDATASIKANVGWLLDRTIGNAWRLVTVIGLGSDKLGLVIIGLALVAVVLSKRSQFNLDDMLEEATRRLKRRE